MSKQVGRQIKAVEAWAQRKGWTITYQKTGIERADFGPNAIYINTGRSTEEHRLFTILHECGHVLVGVKAAEKVDYRNVPKKKRRSVTHKVNVVTNEVLAWEAGRRLASRLGLEIDEDRFNTFKSRYLAGYMKWAHQR